jgi:hypothetical protein
LEVIDIDGSKYDLTWLKERYAAGIELHQAQGYPRFELQKVFITQGPTILRFTVLQADGTPAVGQPAAYSFPTLGSPSQELAPISGDKSAWFGRGCLERCNPRGEHEFQIGSQSWIKNGVGPYAVAVISPSTYSDCLAGLGWLGGTDHRGPCEFLFREVLQPGGTDPGPDPEDPPAGETGAVVEAVNGLRAALVESLGELRGELATLGDDVNAILEHLDGQTPGPAPVITFGLARPLDSKIGTVSQWFGEHPENYATYNLAGHEGMDYAVPEGSEVLAAHAGRVVEAHDEGPYGLHVLVTDDATGVTTVYGHLSRILVAVGQTIQVGSLLGLSGNTGRSTGPHLHFGYKVREVRNPAYGDWLDPALGRKLAG